MKARFLVLLALLGLSGCAPKYDEIARLEMDGLVIQVGLAKEPKGPPEPKKYLEVSRDGSVVRREMALVKGGVAWVALFEERATLEFRDIGGVQYTVPSKGTPGGKRRYLGRFDFDARNTFRFIPYLEDPREPRL